MLSVDNHCRPDFLFYFGRYQLQNSVVCVEVRECKSAESERLQGRFHPRPVGKAVNSA